MEPKATITYDDFSKLDLRVVTILEAAEHPNADRLLKLQVDVGGERRQICAGIRGRYDPQSLVGKQIIIIANLEPRRIRGEDSNGMLLAASVLDGDAVADIVLLNIDKPVPPGSRVS